MVTEKQNEITPEQLLEKASQTLSNADITTVSSESRKQGFIRLYKSLAPEQRLTLAESAATSIKTRFENAGGLDGPIFTFACGVASERDWEVAQRFILSVLKSSSNAEFFKEIAIVLLELIDNEINDKASRLPLAHTSLVILTELGLSLANRAGESRLDNSGSARVVEYITTSMLARSNVNSNAMRIALLHFLSKNPVNKETTQQLNRVISRFGNTLLDDVFNAFFENKRRETAAFYFLLEHLNVFLSVSPTLAEMTHTVMRHFMLKYPTEFPRFLASYAERVTHDEAKLAPLTRHMALLIRTSVEVSQKALTETLGTILMRHLSIFKDSHTPLFEEHVEMACEILLSEPPIRGSKGIVIGELVQSIKHMMLEPKDAGKVVSLARTRKPKEFNVKSAKIGEEPSPLESMLLLAS